MRHPRFRASRCQVDPSETWSETEQRVWNQVCIGEIADLNEHFDSIGPPLDPRSPAGWTEERQLSSEFLETILLYDPWRRAIPRHGVRIIGAWFQEPLDLVEAEIAHEFWLVKARLTSDVDLRRIRTKSLLSLDGSAVTGTVDMNAASIGDSLFMGEGAEFADVVLGGAKIGGLLNLIGAKVTGTLNMDSTSIGGNLLMREGAEFADVDLRGAEIGGQLDMTRAKVTGRLIMDSISIGGDLFMREGAEFADVDLRGAEIGDQLDMTRAKVTGTLNMDSTSIGDSLFMDAAEFADVILNAAQIGDQLSLIGTKVTGTLDMDSTSIGGNLLMREGAEFADVVLRGAKIGGQLDITRAKVTSTLNMDSTSIGESLFMREGQFSKPIELIFARIGSNLDLRGAAVAGLDLTGTQVDGELRLTSASWLPTWADEARLVLINTRVGAVQDGPGGWPQALDLDGFAYERFGGFGTDPETAVGVRGSRWFVEWLAGDEPYSPQPYAQLAKVLREMGHPEMADDVLYAGRERERGEAWQRGENPRWLGLSMLNWTIGYGHGYRFFWALYWVIGLILIGTVVLGVTGQNQRDDGKMIGIWYSLDTLLPIVQLRKEHYDIDLEGFARYWFYGHKLMGYVLASFLIAGLAGLTK